MVVYFWLDRLCIPLTWLLTGELELFVSGTSVISVRGLTLRSRPTSRVKGLHFQTFFGGESSQALDACFSLIRQFKALQMIGQLPEISGRGLRVSQAR